MRRRLVVAAVAVATTIVLAFCIPLARLVRDIAQDQAVGLAERDVERVIGALATSDDEQLLANVVESTPSGADGRLGVVLADSSQVGAAPARIEDLQLARDARSAFTVDAEDGIVLLAPVDVDDGVAVISVRIPSSELNHGVVQAWTLLGLVAAVVLVAGVAMADRLAASITRPAVALADASHRVAQGDLAVRVTPTGPPELERAARGFNDLADRLTHLVAEERQGVADLAHRLRTPLAALRLDVEAVEDDVARTRLVDDVDELERVVDTVIREARRPVRRAVTPVCDLAAVTRDRVSFWSALAEEQGRRWSVEIEADRLPVGLPCDELEAVVDALLDNVFTHTSPGVAFEVRVEAGIEDGSRRVRLIVRDHGPGFGAVEPVDPDGPMLGRTGLGLDIAARAARAAGGSMRSFDDDGAVVMLDLPAVSVDDAGVLRDGKAR